MDGEKKILPLNACIRTHEQKRGREEKKKSGDQEKWRKFSTSPLFVQGRTCKGVRKLEKGERKSGGGEKIKRWRIYELEKGKRKGGKQIMGKRGDLLLPLKHTHMPTRESMGKRMKVIA